jgi:hypothetical protein
METLSQRAALKISNQAARSIAALNIAALNIAALNIAALNIAALNEVARCGHWGRSWQ